MDLWRRQQAILPCMQDAIKKILEELGENPTRNGLKETPRRVEESLRFLTQGYHLSAEEVIADALFEEDHNEMIVVKDIEIYSLCEHHLLPFVGKAHVGYIPNGRIVGLSKIARVADVFARRLQLQERLTKEIADALQKSLRPLGVGVIIEAEHFCMMMRGVEKQNSKAMTSAMRGSFLDDEKTRQEFLRLAVA
ncbi:GTP cyclohydrolase I FolE [Candidatus Kaiserbacteria bacterium RIFCSPLOWO2_12_FULL_53_8]|uniref:GTP cyclohydrolase 1 n=2 Tax=Candidatus Kaiseribacteriota TaxID=1752734 RepID=A0A1F6CVM0_9BACT|nr:MAG: GTP cyclohydrolase I FolE [Candidatus Kaiserbacteria bacterium RIFCSPHIGHO2_01_FULL_53_29]OGG91349.1 MAG: GTP cyclohydrolase I FolE [Candidatus Kaiserbacteria bacterium RIFCSPLOWO2_12_FULL_53_8]